MFSDKTIWLATRKEANRSDSLVCLWVPRLEIGIAALPPVTSGHSSMPTWAAKCGTWFTWFQVELSDVGWVWAVPNILRAGKSTRMIKCDGSNTQISPLPLSLGMPHPNPTCHPRVIEVSSIPLKNLGFTYIDQGIWFWAWPPSLAAARHLRLQDRIHMNLLR